MPDLDDILGVILGGGRGSRLIPLLKSAPNLLSPWLGNTG